ncbi:helix-turn-helix domain-containing protein [Actinoplanes sp. N902-109]|uniref:MarR family transcriptional regulator n=1 Tax=Actinoplanes sp. (strain N902-109) TaxID=649831 RepID=UPI00032962F4|nr:helix-turn-helix domain-containing protein [Actinoplanes sp. N902-109]AGL15159.1 hypothetical protein L083_1649 [Actinoplanes sp. N902-109]
MTTVQSPAAPRMLARAAGERRTGALIVGGRPGGTVYLVEGRVTYAESAAAPGVGELLTVSGRLAARTWQAALDTGTAPATVGRLLLDQGHLTQGELELCVLGATYDAAYFALAAPDAPVDFLAGARHWLGDVVRIDATALVCESRRRALLLDEIVANPGIDTSPVTPVLRAPRERLTLTAAQWELLVHADGQRTPADLAQLLGRAGYATVQELRRLAALGLIEQPPAGAPDRPDFVRLPRARGTAVDIRKPAARDGTVPIPVAVAPVAASGDPPPAQRQPALARRRPGARLPEEFAAEPAPPPLPGTDEVLLKRIRTALRALR